MPHFHWRVFGCRFRLIVMVLACVVTARSAFAELEFQKVQWGFENNFVQRNAFNPLTVEVFNASDKVADGVLILTQNQGIGRVDIPIQQSIAIEPRGRRAIQFTIFVDESPPVASFQFHPDGGRPEKTFSLVDPPPVHDGAIVYLREAQRITPPPRGIPAFDEANFPTSVVGTRGLTGLLLDHVPDLDELRRQALVDWLHEGGTLHILRSPTDELVQFSGLLAALNDPSEQFPVGAGRVIRHGIARQVDRADILESHPRQKEIEAAKGNPNQNQNNFNNNNYRYYGSFPSQIFGNLRSVSRPEHQWGLIWLLAFLYLLVIFPGCWLIGGRKADYRITYAIILGAVFVFSTAFKWIGKRGYGEQMTMSSVALAKDLGGGRYDVFQWDALFVTDGGVYTVKHDSQGTAYGAGTSDEAVRGAATNRPGAEFSSEVPPFSSRTYVHGGVIKTPHTDIQVTAREHNNNVLSVLELELPPTLKPLPGGYVLYDETAYPLSVVGTKATKSVSGTPIQDLQSNTQNYGNPYYRQNAGPTESLFDNCVLPTIQFDLGFRSQSDPKEFRPPKGVARVYVPAQMSDEYFAKLGDGVRQAGRVLYRYDIPVSNSNEMTP
jgi:hypothetical protein